MPIYLVRKTVLLVALLLMGACASNEAKITYAWKSDNIDENRGGKGVLVLAVSKHPEARARFEDAFTKSLNREGVRAVASYTLNPAKEISREDINAMAAKANTDYALITSFAGRDQTEVLHRGGTYYAVMPIYTGTGGYYGRGGVYGAPFEVGHVPDFYAQHKSLHLEANLYVIASGDHMWRAASGVEESGDNRAMVEAFIDAYIKQLKVDLKRQ